MRLPVNVKMTIYHKRVGELEVRKFTSATNKKCNSASLSALRSFERRTKLPLSAREKTINSVKPFLGGDLVGNTAS
jgi:hypothetical protein